MREYPGHYVIDRWIRLPVFLQQAGRFDEAMQEFEKLLKEVQGRVRQETLENATENWISYQEHINYQKIYDKMRMVCKREKWADEVKKYASLATRHAEEVERLREVVDKEWQAERDAYQRKKN